MPTAQAGKDMYLQDGTGTGATKLAMLRSTGLDISGQSVDVTNIDSNGFRELGAAMGIVSASIKAEAVASDSTQATAMMSRCIARTNDLYTLVMNNGDKIVGSFQLTNFSQKGEYNGEQLYNLTLESNGTLTVTAV